MKVLIVGGGGREHALAWKLAQDDPRAELMVAPGNPGIAELARCVPVAADDVSGLLALGQRERPALTIVGPEAPLAAGIADLFRGVGLPIFGPTRDAARIESSKRFAKELMLAAGVPTAHATWHRDASSARRAAAALGAPVVIKASGLAAGKGVVVAESLDAAEQAIDAMLRSSPAGDGADAELLVEEYMDGEELSVFAVTDGTTFRTMLPAQDHKRLLDGDVGPNTGGMGAYAPVSIATPELLSLVDERVFAPTLGAMRERGTPFTGLLYAGIMMRDGEPRVVEFNCRFGDPETQAILPLMRGPLLPALMAVARGGSLADVAPFEWLDGASATTVVAARGYPGTVETGAPITLPPPDDDVLVFHAGTARASGAGAPLVTAGGRVLAVTAVAPTLDAAAERSRAYAERVELAGKQLRRDIGWRERRRHAGAA